MIVDCCRLMCSTSYPIAVHSHSAFPPGRRPLWPLRAGGRIPNSEFKRLCPPSSVLRLLSSVPCPLSSALCPLSSALCPLSSALCLLPSVLCPLPSALCHLPSVICPLSSAFCHLPSVICHLKSVLWLLKSGF